MLRRDDIEDIDDAFRIRILEAELMAEIAPAAGTARDILDEIDRRHASLLPCRTLTRPSFVEKMIMSTFEGICHLAREHVHVRPRGGSREDLDPTYRLPIDWPVDI